MTDWVSLIPRSLFSILGSGRSPELYPVYLDILIALYQRTIGSGLPYNEARDIADDILLEYNINQLPEEDDEDDGNIDDTDGITISNGAKVLRRLKKAKWLKRETDVAAKDVIRFPLYVFKLLPIFIRIKEDQQIEYDALLFSISKLLSKDVEIPRKQAINRAYQQMVELTDNVQALLQLIASMQPDVERLTKETISPWLGQYLDSQTQGHYTHLKLRNSPDKWYADIVDQARQLHEERETIAEESLRSSIGNIEHPPPIDIRESSNYIAKQLRYIEQQMEELSQMIKEMDSLEQQLARTYTRRVDLVTASANVQLLLESSKALFDRLQTLPGRGNPKIDFETINLPGLKAISPHSANWRSRTPSQKPIYIEDLVILNQEELSSEELQVLIHTSSLGPHEVEAHFDQIFDGKQEMMVSDLLGETIEDAQKLIRLLNYCGLGEFGFGIFALEQQGFHTPLPMVENDYLRVSNVIIRRRGIPNK